MNKIETPEDRQIMTSHRLAGLLLSQTVRIYPSGSKEVLPAYSIESAEELIDSCFAALRADERQKAAERAREYLKTNNAYNGLYAAILAEPEPDVELLPDAEYGFVARYKSLTADGKTKDEAMQKLARVILAAFDLDSKWVPTAMLEEAYTRGYQDAFGNVKDMDYDTLAAKYGYHVE